LSQQNQMAKIYEFYFDFVATNSHQQKHDENLSQQNQSRTHRFSPFVSIISL